MKYSKRRIRLLVIVLGGLINLPQSTNCQAVFNPDSTHLLLDTVRDSVRLGGKMIELWVFRDRPAAAPKSVSINGDSNIEQSPITIIFYDKETAKEIYRKKFDFDRGSFSSLKYHYFKAGYRKYSDSGILYLEINLSAGGSGSLSHFYFIRLENGQMKWASICQSQGELSSLLVNNNDKGILLLEAVWNIKEEETHFGKHRYRIREFVYSGNGFREKWIGQTVLKYASMDETHSGFKILGDIKNKEPQVVKNINFTNFK